MCNVLTLVSIDGSVSFVVVSLFVCLRIISHVSQASLVLAM